MTPETGFALLGALIATTVFLLLAVVLLIVIGSKLVTFLLRFEAFSGARIEGEVSLQGRFAQAVDKLLPGAPDLQAAMKREAAEAANVSKSQGDS